MKIIKTILRLTTCATSLITLYYVLDIRKKINGGRPNEDRLMLEPYSIGAGSNAYNAHKFFRR